MPRHTAGKSTVFGTALNYCTIRLLGVDREDAGVVKARALLHKMGKMQLGMALNGPQNLLFKADSVKLAFEIHNNTIQILR